MAERKARPRLVGAQDGRAVYEVASERAARRLCEDHAGPGAAWLWSSRWQSCGDMARYFDEWRDGGAVWRVVLKAWPDPREE